MDNGWRTNTKTGGRFNINKIAYSLFHINELKIDEDKETQMINEYMNKKLREKSPKQKLEEEAQEAYSKGIDLNEFARQKSAEGINAYEIDNAYRKAREKALNGLYKADAKIFKKDYIKYMLEHPESKITYEEYKDYFTK